MNFLGGIDFYLEQLNKEQNYYVKVFIFILVMSFDSVLQHFGCLQWDH